MNKTTALAPFPTREEHEQAWRELAGEIASARHRISEETQTAGGNNGELLILGSGIETMGFSRGDEKLILAADKVFFCVADPATVVWIKNIRPDAYDLYVLYNDDKVRYTTYVQMTEAMLHYVRQGKKVAAIYYGHPGIFVFSTHRAIRIARREGYRAVMRPGVCALDCLCADLGVDPCQPGMQTHEATDMLIRRRVPDTSLHVVLWQVGLIGEMGFRRGGYINKNFSVFIEYLQQYYGRDYPVVNYIASRYPAIPPVMETYALEELHDPVNQARVTGISTFYLAPRDVTRSDEEMLMRLGLMKPGQHLMEPSRPLREIDKYGLREQQALADFEQFQVPRGYHWQEKTRASEFILALQDDPALKDLFARDPETAVSAEVFPGLSPREQRLLITGNAGAIQLAAKGDQRKSIVNETLLHDLLNIKALAREVLRTAGKKERRDRLPALKTLFTAKGYDIDWSVVPNDIDEINRSRLYPWTGIYPVHAQKILITVIGSVNHNMRSHVYVNTQQVRPFAYGQGILRWKAADGNPHNGFLRFHTGAGGRRTLNGSIWPADAQADAASAIEATEADLDFASLLGSTVIVDPEPCAGTYVFRLAEDRAPVVDEFAVSGSKVTINGRELQNTVFTGGKLHWKDDAHPFTRGEITFLTDPVTRQPLLFGQVWYKTGEAGIKCYGTIPLSLAASSQIAATPACRLPAWAWEHLVHNYQISSLQGGLMIWHKCEKFRFTSLIMNNILTRLFF